MSDQSDDNDSFADFLAFLSPTSNSNNVDSSSNVDGATAEDITASSLGSIQTANIDIETGNIPKRRRSSVTFNSEIDNVYSIDGVGLHLSSPTNDVKYIEEEESDEYQFLVDSFNAADTDGNGSLSHDELRDLLRSLGLQMVDDENLNKWINDIDGNNDGEIDMIEFQLIFEKIKLSSNCTFDKLLRETFDMYDADGSGDIDQSELKTLMAQLGFDLSDEELSNMVAEVDVDGNGEIDFTGKSASYDLLSFIIIILPEFVQLFKGSSKGNEGKSNTPMYKRKEASLFDNAKQYIQFGPMLRFVTWLYSGRKLLLLLCSHFVASLIIWAHFAMIRYEQQEGTVPEDASRYTAKRIVPPFLYGSKHCILFQMALIPLTMSRYTIAALSSSKLNYYLPLDKSLRIHIYLGYTMVSISFMALIIFFVFLGLLCSEGDDASCDKLGSEIMITGYCIVGLLALMTGTAYYRHTIPYEVFYRVHFTFLVVYFLTIIHTIDAAQRSGEKNRSQTYKWYIVPLLYYSCDYMMMWFNQRFKTKITSFTAVENEGSKMIILKMRRPTLFHFQPGQYAFLRVDSIDRSWHPFSIASQPSSNEVEFYIEVYGEGSWTDLLWSKLKSSSKLYVDLLGPYGTGLVKDPSYTNIVAIGSGTGIVPCTSLLKEHVRKMVMLDPENYLIERAEHMKQVINTLGAQEVKDGSLSQHMTKTLKGFMFANQNQDKVVARAVARAHRQSSNEDLKSYEKQQVVRDSLNALDYSSCGMSLVHDTLLNYRSETSRVHDVIMKRHKAEKTAKEELKKATFRATQSFYGTAILTFVTLFGVIVFSLNLSWTLTTAEIDEDMMSNLEIITILLHAIFFVCSFFIWNGVTLQSYVDGMLSVALPFLDWYYHSIVSLSIGQVITLSIVNGYITFRFYQKTLATVGQHTTEENVEHLHFIWTVRSVKIARQLYPEILETYDQLVEEWGEEYAGEVLDVSIYITDKDRNEAATFRAEIRTTSLFKSRRVLFIRPKLGDILEEHVQNLFEIRPAYSSTLVAFCGGPGLSRIIGNAISTVKLLNAATGHNSHRLDFVSESYGGKKKGSTKQEARKKKDEEVSLWDVVKKDTVIQVNSKRVKSVFEDESDKSRESIVKEYNSKREMIEEYRRAGSILRYRGKK